jgi:hypothetical protein
MGGHDAPFFEGLGRETLAGFPSVASGERQGFGICREAAGKRRGSGISCF